MKRFSKITTTQLARICGVSQGTVDRALHDRGEIKAETKEKILAVAKEYDYISRLGNAAIGQGKSMLIGVVLYDLYNEFFSKLAMSFVEQAKRAGYSVIFLFSNGKLRGEKSAVDYFNYIGVDGIVLFTVGSDDEKYAQYLHSIKKPIVLIGNRISDLEYIGVDDHKAMYDLTEKLIKETDENTEEIVYFAPVLAQNLSKKNAQNLRFAGFKRAIADGNKRYRLVTDAEELTENVSAIVCSTDHYVLQALKKIGYGTDKRIAGFDNISLLKYIPVRVLTVEYFTDEIALNCLKYVLGKKYKSTVGHCTVRNV